MPDPIERRPVQPAPGPLDSEDATLVTLARAARARIGAVEGAAVRDGDGRTYAAGTVGLRTLALSALQLAVANAVAAGAGVIEAAAVVSDSSTVDSPGVAAVAEVSPTAPTFLAGGDGTVVGVVSLDGVDAGGSA